MLLLFAEFFSSIVQICPKPLHGGARNQLCGGDTNHFTHIYPPYYELGTRARKWEQCSANSNEIKPILPALILHFGILDEAMPLGHQNDYIMTLPTSAAWSPPHLPETNTVTGIQCSGILKPNIVLVMHSKCITKRQKWFKLQWLWNTRRRWHEGTNGFYKRTRWWQDQFTTSIWLWTIIIL